MREAHGSRAPKRRKDTHDVIQRIVQHDQYGADKKHDSDVLFMMGDKGGYLYKSQQTAERGGCESRLGDGRRSP